MNTNTAMNPSRTFTVHLFVTWVSLIVPHPTNYMHAEHHCKFLYVISSTLVNLRQKCIAFRGAYELAYYFTFLPIHRSLCVHLNNVIFYTMNVWDGLKSLFLISDINAINNTLFPTYQLLCRFYSQRRKTILSLRDCRNDDSLLRVMNDDCMLWDKHKCTIFSLPLLLH